MLEYACYPASQPLGSYATDLDLLIHRPQSLSLVLFIFVSAPDRIMTQSDFRTKCGLKVCCHELAIHNNVRCRSSSATAVSPWLTWLWWQQSSAPCHFYLFYFPHLPCLDSSRVIRDMINGHLIYFIKRKFSLSSIISLFYYTKIWTISLH